MTNVISIDKNTLLSQEEAFDLLSQLFRRGVFSSVSVREISSEKGSLDGEAKTEAQNTPSKKGRGRPKGSKNKPKDVLEKEKVKDAKIAKKDLPTEESCEHQKSEEGGLKPRQTPKKENQIISIEKRSLENKKRAMSDRAVKNLKLIRGLQKGSKKPGPF